MEKISENPQAFSKDAFRDGCWKIRTRDYFRTSGIGSYLNQIFKNKKLKFGVPMFLWCLLGTLVVCGIGALAEFMLMSLGRIDNLVMISVGVFVFIVFAVIDFCLWPRRSKGLKKK